MKKTVIFLIVLILVISCSKNSDNTITNEKNVSLKIKSDNANINAITKLKLAIYDTTELRKYLIYNPVTDKEKDSIALRKIAVSGKSACESYSGDNPEYSDYSGHIHFKVFYTTTPQTANHQVQTASVSSAYAMVGGGAWVRAYTGNGAWLYESKPLNATTWEGKSKDHIIQDPHCLTVFAIGMRIDGVDPTVLRSHIYIKSYTLPATSKSNFPETSVLLPDNYLLVGGGAFDDWTGYGNMLTASYPIGNEWHAAGKAYRRSDPSTITAYAIGIENISYPTVGYLGVTVRQNTVNVPTGPEDESVYATVWDGYALTCPGGYCTYNGWGRMLVGVFPLDTPADANTISKDSDVYPDYGTDSAFAIGIEKRPY